jgi:hypothetical protein
LPPICFAKCRMDTWTERFNCFIVQPHSLRHRWTSSPPLCESRKPRGVPMFQDVPRTLHLYSRA